VEGCTSTDVVVLLLFRYAVDGWDRLDRDRLDRDRLDRDRLVIDMGKDGITPQRPAQRIRCT
jgi:hypothetical protein